MDNMQKKLSNWIHKLPDEYVRQLSMIKESERLASLDNWVFDDEQPCSAFKMAEAGFYSVATKEEPDAAQCFLCDKTLDGWEANDDPWKYHKKECAFSKLQLAEEDLTMSQFADFRKQQLYNIMNQFFDNLIEETTEKFNEIVEILDDLKANN